jgi:hypothetical protein
MSSCVCDKWLSEYVLIYPEDPSAYVNADFILDHGVMIDFAERTQKLIEWNKVRELRTMYALTIAELFRLIEFWEGNTSREPLHRILNEDREEIHSCRVKTTTLESLGQNAMERFLSKYDNAGHSRVSETKLSG